MEPVPLKKTKKLVYDLLGKTVLPFCTHGGSGLSGTDKNIQNEEKAIINEISEGG